MKNKRKQRLIPPAEPTGNGPFDQLSSPAHPNGTPVSDNQPRHVPANEVPAPIPIRRTA